MNGFYPIILQLRGKRCVVIGGGAVAERKMLGLLDAGADHVIVISPAVTPRIEQLSAAGVILLERRDYEEDDVRGAWLIFAATSDKAVNAAIAAAGERLDILVNAADESSRSSFITPSVVRRGDLLLAVTASGASPALSQQIKTELEERYGSCYEEITARLRRLRERAISRVLDERDRQIVLRLAAEEAVQLTGKNFDVDEWLQSLLHRIDRGHA
ncbi:bifunctional precorrin-2 dehydrogenase/sirohydrochlorin ferrochelatase [Paenibacillus alkaliterrae]|uniref:precorrin-2 dehydrogenase/sirohydrochlorin ferrochelatase family protein n=1 Tax=Paenibacillus alkaliterrae TaxID=320909 RepID=UPI001F25E3B3|nr:bifunctional precorrin-2 dehydrogenase/sirohydrochlorin ferrochelatase [Paenibacillus alkaliterrae]MCF2937318.1 bifunctional precorrin-2 dehydrogenase/sirohydrochlorin ferrochelatase [Paenibacillus alkaliterrae]